MKKFNAFSGVFTPSVLTILGVIMYMRLGWVVGEAGLIYALIIIVIAHIISFSTGLSISSIATDKKIKTGGIYYILSRSLGLPMGGAIGIALTVGMAFSIALYVIGFLESFLSVEAIASFVESLGLDPTSKNTFRIFGSAVLILLVVLAFISTSLAIKTQIFIFIAIGLSLVSVVVGLFTYGDFSFSNALWQKADSNVTIEYIFAIFFPAVTGFTAGVSMSGDLKNPKKDIPKGTMLAIIVGFIIYVALALLIGFTMKRELLIENMNFLMVVSWIAMLVLAGVWGATLSSALGGILGGPRITQAISGDKILPKFLAKGYGAGNEPRVALIATFLIAEAGILIGELNAIASIVSMFYLASYGFINLAFFLESSASTDFRPSFRVPKWVGLIGFIASFIVMFRLDMFSMFIALTLMFIIYIFLKRREIKLDFGDVWQSVGTTIVRNILTRMNKKTIEQRNWRPNLILFSGGTNKREHLLELGKAIVGKYGFLSNFDIIKNNTSHVLFPKHKQNIVVKEEKSSGVFTRKKTCKNVYEGIETISATYGFSGVEPDTVMLGWARQSSNPVRFAKMIRTLNKLDLNIILIDYDQRFGYGKYQLIDIWWRGAGNNGNFALSLIKFLWASNQWRDARLRLMIVNQVNSEAENIQNNVNEILDNLRVEAEIRIINNEMEQKSFYEIIKVESINTDLTFIGIPPVIDGKEDEFVSKTNDLMHEIGTVILIKASSLFKNLHIGSNPKLYKKRTKNIEPEFEVDFDAKKIQLPTNTLINKHIEELIFDFNILNEDFSKNYLMKFNSHNNKLLFNIKGIITKHFSKIYLSLNKTDTDIIISSEKALINILLRIRKEINSFNNEILIQQKQLIEKAINEYQNKISDLINSSEKKFIRSFNLKDVEAQKNDSTITKITKKIRRVRIKITGHPIRYKIKYRKLLKKYFPVQSQIILKKNLRGFGRLNISILFELHNLQRMLKERLLLINIKARSKELTTEIFYNKKHEIFEQINKIEKINKKSTETVHLQLNNATTEIIKQLNSDIYRINPNKNISLKKIKNSDKKRTNKFIEQIPTQWFSNKQLLFNGLILENQLYIYENRLRKIIKESIFEIKKIISQSIIKDISYLISIFPDNTKKEVKFEPEIKHEHLSKEFYLSNFNKIIDIAFKNLKLTLRGFPQNLELLSVESYNNISNKQFQNIAHINIAITRSLDYIIQDELISPFRNITEQLPSKIIEQQSNIQNILIEINNKLENISTNNKEQKIEIQKSKFELLKIKKETEKLLEQINLQITERLNGTINKILFQSFLKFSSDNKQYVRKLDKRKHFKTIRKNFQKLRSILRKQFSQLWLKQSEAVLAKERLSKESLEHNKVNDLLDLLENASIKTEVKEKLPFYYQQLFLRRYNYSNEFWFGRKNELQIAKKTLKKYYSGFYGGLLIIGEQFSGKTFLSNFIANNYTKNSTVYTINPPYSGSVNTDDFIKSLKESTTLRGSVEQIFNKLPLSTTIIIDDLELWWEKSKNGLKVIKYINNIIEKYSEKVFFVVNCKIQTYILINKIFKIDNSFLNIIECEPFNAEQLKNIILFRHQSSNLRIKLGRKPEERIKAIDYARLFNKIFQYTRGNIGFSLQTWIVNITEFNNKTLNISYPKKRDLSALDILEQDDLLLLTHFVIHKRMLIEKAERVTFIEKEVLLKKINYLKRNGIIIEKMPKVYEINPFIYIHLIEKLKEKKYL